MSTKDKEMIYVYHDFYSNFTASIKSGDYAMTTTIFVNELSDLIVYDTKSLVDALNKVGIKASEAQTDEELVDSVIGNLPSNTNLVNALAFLIADSNKIINKKGDKPEKSMKVVNSIADGVFKLSKQLSEDGGSLKVQMKKDVMEQIVTKANAKGDYKRTIWIAKNTRRKIFFVVGGLALIALVGYGIYRYRQSKLTPSLEGGGGLPTPQPPIANPQFVQPAPPPVAMAQPTTSVVTQPIAQAPTMNQTMGQPTI